MLGRPRNDYRRIFYKKIEHDNPGGGFSAGLSML
jgi:hypothetical protein